MKKDVFRIVKYKTWGYEYRIQIKSWWLPFWTYIGFNYYSVEEAESDVELLIKNREKTIKKPLEVVKYIYID